MRTRRPFRIRKKGEGDRPAPVRHYNPYLGTPLPPRIHYCYLLFLHQTRNHTKPGPDKLHVGLQSDDVLVLEEIAWTNWSRPSTQNLFVKQRFFGAGFALL